MESAGSAGGVPTIRDVARLAGVSKSLVSLVLNNSPKVSEVKRDAVLAAMRDLGYRPNAAARSLTERRTRTVGILVNDLRNPWYVDILEGMNSQLHAQDLTMLLGDARLDRTADERLLRTFLEMRVDGLVLVGSQPMTATVVEASGVVPMVVAGARDVDLPRVDVCSQDDEGGAVLATEHLLSLGHRRIVHLTGSYEASMSLRRLGFETAVDRVLPAVGAAHVVETEPTEAGGYHAAMALFDGVEPTVRPTAVFAMADVVALGVLRALAALGLEVPGDVSVCGFDDVDVAGLPGIDLTTVDGDSGWIGRTAVELLGRRLTDPGRRRVTRLSRSTLVIRRTTAAPCP